MSRNPYFNRVNWPHLWVKPGVIAVAVAGKGSVIDMKMDWKTCCQLATAEIEAILADLPTPLREQAEKLPITFEPKPNKTLQTEGIEADTLGLFTGPEFAEEGHVPMPPQIILFLENIKDYVEGDEKAFRIEVGTTFFHELGHYFGLDEDDLTARGLD